MSSPITSLPWSMPTEFRYFLGTLDLLSAILLYVLLTVFLRPSHFSHRAIRLPSGIFIWFGTGSLYSGYRGFCSHVWGRSSTQLKPWELDGYERLRREDEVSRGQGGQREGRLSGDGEEQVDSRASWGLHAVQVAKKIGASRAREMESVESFGFMGNGQGIGHGLVHVTSNDPPEHQANVIVDGSDTAAMDRVDDRPPWEHMDLPDLNANRPLATSPQRAMTQDDSRRGMGEFGANYFPALPLTAHTGHFNTYPRAYPQAVSPMTSISPTRSLSVPFLPSQSWAYGNELEDIELRTTPVLPKGTPSSTSARPAIPFDAIYQMADRPVTYLHPQPTSQSQRIATDNDTAGLDDILASTSDSTQSKDLDSDGYSGEDHIVMFGPEQVVQDPILRRYYESIIRDILICMIICTSAWIALCLAVPLRGLA